MTTERINRGMILEVPFEEKDEAKRIGAKWDPDLRKWFVPNGIDSKPFSKWIPDEE